MMRRFKTVQRFKKCNTQQTFRERTRVDSREFRGEVRGEHTAPPRMSTQGPWGTTLQTRGAQSKGPGKAPVQVPLPQCDHEDNLSIR